MTSIERGSGANKRKTNKEKNINSRELRKQKKTNKLAEKSQEQSKLRNQILTVLCIYVFIGIAVLYLYGVPKSQNMPPEVEQEILRSDPQDAKKVQRPIDHGKDEDKKDPADAKKKMNSGNGLGVEATQPFPNFKPNIQSNIKPKNLSSDKRWKKLKILKNNSTTSVKVYIMDNFLSTAECDGLVRAHNNHLLQYSKDDPIFCFSGFESLRKHLREYGYVKLSKEMSENDFTAGTLCLNTTMSAILKSRLKWSSSTSFYSGESKFSSQFESKVEQTTGLDKRNGGKFQVTSYSTGVGYKGHTDCAIGNLDGRDRFATILVYLTDVAEGGHTSFPELGVKVQPRKGRALLWNNMDSDGHCDPLSHHKADSVTNGRKIILQRWYYYQNFPLLGKRYNEPSLPPRGSQTARVSCDEYEFGSCRWYDEWTYDHLTSYSKVKHSLK